MAEPEFLSGGNVPRRTDTRWFALQRILAAVRANSGGGAAAAWGAITGTLADQTDLQAELDALLSESGGTLTGNLLFSPDNTHSVGADGATRPKDIFAAGSVTSNVASFSQINAGSYVNMAGWWIMSQGNNKGIGFGSAHRLVWESTATNTDTNIAGDTGIARTAAGVMEINNGTAGTKRDLSLRNLTQSAAALLSITSGANQRAGNLTLIGGTLTVSNTTITANSVIMLTRKATGGTIGMAVTYTLNAGVGFTVTSDNVLDTSIYSYLIIEVP